MLGQEQVPGRLHDENNCMNINKYLLNLIFVQLILYNFTIVQVELVRGHEAKLSV